MPVPTCTPDRAARQSSGRSLPISRLCLARTRRPLRNRDLSSRRHESLSGSSFAVERSDVSTDSPERPRGFLLSSLGTGARETDGRPLSRWRKLTNERPSGARSHPLLGRLPTSSCWSVRLTNPAPHAGWPDRRSGEPRKKGSPESPGDWLVCGAESHYHPTRAGKNTPGARSDEPVRFSLLPVHQLQR